MNRCPHCPTHPKLVQSGWAELSLKCPVCNQRFAGPGESEEPERERPADPYGGYWDYWKKYSGSKTQRKP